MSKKTSIQKRTPGSLHPAGSAAGRGKRAILELARDFVDNDLRNGRTCPNDTDGDGDCGRPMCPVCGTRRQNLSISELSHPVPAGLAPLISIDTETGGAGELQCTTHALLSVGAYTTLPDATGAPRQLTFHQLILPEPHLKIEEEARKVNGYNYAEWKMRGAVDEHTALMRFVNWTAMAYAVAGMQNGEKLQFLSHNVGHDRGFLYAGLKRTGMLDTLGEMVSRRWECSCAALAYWRRKYEFPGGCSLDDMVALQTGVSLEEVKAARGVHRADVDAKMCWLGYQWLLLATPADVLWAEDDWQQKKGKQTKDGEEGL